MISDRDVAFFHEQGYLVVPNVLDQSSVETHCSSCRRRTRAPCGTTT
jgi:hypothetical protein